MAAEANIVLGRLVRPVGLKGELKLLPSPDFWPEALASSRLRLEQGGGERGVRVTGARPAGDCLVLVLAGVVDRDAAEALRDAELTLAGELDVEPPAEPRAWQLRGMSVRCVGGEALGEVADLLPMPAQPLLQVKGPTKVYSIPFVAPILRGIDWEARTIEVDPPEGLLDL